MARSVCAAVLGLAVAVCCTATLATATEWTVGDAKGWSFGVAGWENGKAFKAGDVLDFKYDAQMHNVVQVDQAGYDACAAGAGSKTFSSGDDKIALAAGRSFFICSFPGHCAAGMKIAVAAK
ncbi:hypothetical protein ABZP36_031507 [Zizania latifolia]